MTNFPRDLTILLAPINNEPAEAVAPANAHIATHPLPLSITPAIGVPISPPILMIAKPMPILVPIRPRLGDNRTKQAGGSETKDPEKNPYRIEITTIAATLWVPIRPKMITPAAKPHGTIMLKGPVLSAMKLGMMRPAIEAVLRMARR